MLNSFTHPHTLFTHIETTHWHFLGAECGIVVGYHIMHTVILESGSLHHKPQYHQFAASSSYPSWNRSEPTINTREETQVASVMFSEDTEVSPVNSNAC